MQYDIIFLII